VKLAPAQEIVGMLAEPIVEDLPFKPGDEVLAFVNGVGGTPLIELYIVYNELNNYLKGKGIKIARNLVGSYITSLEMAGTSITLLKLDEQLKELWDAPVKTPGLRWGA
jgi:dihydroxyacetone kinase-like protein